MSLKTTSRNPWSFIPTLYFAEGFPYVLINTVSVVVYKRLDIDNATIAFFTSFLYLPWVIKMFWGPLVDTRSTKRNWIIGTQLAMTACLAIVAAAIRLPGFFLLSLTAFFIGALISSTHDIAVDGFYLLALDTDHQSLFVGIRSTFYRFAMIAGQGLLVWFAGILEVSTGDTPKSWSIAFGCASAMFLCLFLFHRSILPSPVADTTSSQRAATQPSAFVDVFSTYFRQPKIWAIVLFILLYRFGEALVLKLASPFFLDSPAAGGLGMSTSEVGIVYGTIGVGSLLTGGIIGGIVLRKFGLRKCLWPMAVIINMPMYVYTVLSTLRPDIVVTACFVALEQFSYGFGFAAYSVYLMFISRGKYATSHFAISTGLMALGMMLPGFASGYIQKALGYQHFFILTAVLGIPGILTLFIIPLPETEPEKPSAP